MWMKWRKALKPKRKFLPWPKVERLEHRICLSTYDYTVIAQTGDQGLVSLGNGASINDSGQVAFVGNFADGSNGIFVGNGSTPSEFNDVTENAQSPNQIYQPTVQINNSGEIAAVDRVSGGPPSYDLKVWNGSNDTYTTVDSAGPGANYDSFFNSDSISNDDSLAYIGKLAGASTVILLRDGQPISSLPSPQPYLNPMIANGGLVVARVDHNTTNPDQNPIELFQSGQPATIIASATDFSSLGASPGISDDGQTVAFYGVLEAAGAARINSRQPSQFPQLQPGPGIFLSVETSRYGRIVVRDAGIAGNGKLDPGETFKDANNDGKFEPNETEYGVSNFDADQRIAVTSIQGNGPAFTNPAVTVVFMGQDSTTSNDALFCNRVDFLGALGAAFNPANPQSFRVNTDTIIAEVGDSINDIRVPGNIQTINISDPINNNGAVAFEVKTSGGYGGSSAVVVANPIPVLAVPPLNQGNSNWAGRTYAYGVPYDGPGQNHGQPETIGESGCTMTALAMAINYAGFPYLRYGGTSSYTPATLNRLLLVEGDYSDIGWPDYVNATNDALKDGGVTGLKFHLDDFGSSSTADLANLLQTYHAPVLVRVHNNGHTVIVTGMSRGQFTIIDPGALANTTLSGSFQIRGWIGDPTDLSELSFVVEGAVRAPI